MKCWCIYIALILLCAAGVAQPLVDKNKFHLFLLAGQSNMAGRGDVLPEDTIANPAIWMLNKKNEWEPAKEPLHFDKPSIVGVGPGLAFARAMAAKDTSIIIGLVPCAVGGSGIDAWQPGAYYAPTQSYPYDDAVKRVQAAQQYGQLQGILWQQGESDSDSIRAKSYAVKLVDLVKRFRIDLHDDTLFFAAGTMGDFYIASHPYAALVNTAILQLPRTLKHTATVNAAGLTDKGDQVHFNSASARALGIRYAEVFQSTLNLQK